MCVSWRSSRSGPVTPSSAAIADSAAAVAVTLDSSVVFGPTMPRRYRPAHGPVGRSTTVER